MPRRKDASQQAVFHVNTVIPRDIYLKFRQISAHTMIGMNELYKKACEEFVEQNCVLENENEYPKERKLKNEYNSI